MSTHFAPAVPIWLACLCGGVLGAIIGSFIGAVLLRWPDGRSVVTGRSACESCGRILRARDLVPIVSYMDLRGKCARCGTPIDRWAFAAELGGAMFGAGAWLVTDDLAAALWVMVLGWQLLLLALLDARHMWLPDRLTVLLALTGAVFALTTRGTDLRALFDHMLGGVLGFTLLFAIAALYRRLRGFDGLGAGDPKLLGALGLWLGTTGVVVTLLGASVIGLGTVAILLLAGRKLSARTAMPLGTCLSIAGIVAYSVLN